VRGVPQALTRLFCARGGIRTHTSFRTRRFKTPGLRPARPVSSVRCPLIWHCRPASPSRAASCLGSRRFLCTPCAQGPAPRDASWSHENACVLGASTSTPWWASTMPEAAESPDLGPRVDVVAKARGRHVTAPSFATRTAAAQTRSARTQTFTWCPSGPVRRN
jgi:hypothetical protein